MLHLAGYPNQNPVQGTYVPVHGQDIAKEFHYILESLEEIAARKVDGYGPFRYENLSTWRWEVQALYQDIERKFERLKTMCKPEPTNNRDLLVEVLQDLAVYSARGLQIIYRLEPKIIYHTSAGADGWHHRDTPEDSKDCEYCHPVQQLFRPPIIHDPSCPPAPDNKPIHKG
jgi:hypothetical protein